MDEAEYCDRISIMVSGRIAAMDSPAGLKKKKQRRHAPGGVYPYCPAAVRRNA